jgi:excisionase family DNA binding protein
MEDDLDVEPLRFLTLQETAQLLHVSSRTLQRLIRRKNLPAIRVGHQWRIRPAELANWLESLSEL